MTLLMVTSFSLVLVVVTSIQIPATSDIRDSSIGGFSRGVSHNEASLQENYRIKYWFMTSGTCAVSKDKGWYDEELGNFTITPDSPYCDASCGRSSVCCAPQKPSDVQITFYHFDMHNKSLIVSLTSPESANVVQQNPKLVWFIHGYNDSIFKNPVFNQTKDAFLRRGYDVILVDWSRANGEYFQAIANCRLVGALTGQMITKYGVEKTSTCIGFSLGAHICGEVGAWVRQHGHVLVNRCIGIDPAGPAFDNCTDTIRLDKTDCGLVTAIHTSQFEGIGSLINNEGFGTKDTVGHCDFWANDAKDQPWCSSKACSHERAMDYFLSQVNKTCMFIGHELQCDEKENGEKLPRGANVGKECSSYEPYHRKSGLRRVGFRVDRDSQDVLCSMLIPPDDKCTPECDVDYQFDTTFKEPYC